MSLMNRRTLLLFLGAMAAARPARAFEFSPSYLRSLLPFSRRATRQSLLVAGSTSMIELNHALATEFMRRQSDIDVVVETGGSLPALIALKRGAIDVAAMVRALTEGEDAKAIRSYLIARDAVGIIVSNTSKVASLTTKQVSGLLRGEIDDWAQVGGEPGPVHVVVRRPGTSARLFLEEEILFGDDVAATSRECETPKDVMDAVAGDPNAIGVVLMRDQESDERVRYLPIDGVDISTETILSSRYPFTESLCLVVMTDDLESAAQKFVDFARSPSGQKIAGMYRLIPTN